MNYSGYKLSDKGQIVGKADDHYYLFSYQIIGMRVWLMFEKTFGKDLPEQYQDLPIFPGLTRDWRTQIHVQQVIRDLYRPS